MLTFTKKIYKFHDFAKHVYKKNNNLHKKEQERFQEFISVLEHRVE